MQGHQQLLLAGVSRETPLAIDLEENGGWERFREGVRSLVGRTVLSPLFLVTSILVFTLIPERVLREGFSSVVGQAWKRFAKRSIDIIGSTIGLILSSPLFVIVPILIKLDSKGPVFYLQQRVGQNRRKGERRRSLLKVDFERRDGDRRKKNLYGRPFYLYKFRTMRDDAEKKSGPVWARRNDPRVTRVGRILRITHIDEIPQFINILKGEMSLVGPRPERPHFVNKLITILPEYSERLKVKPGLTGWAQINCGYDYSIEDVKKKLKYDLDYVNNGTLLSDLKIMALTIVRVLTGKGDI